ncbi:MAG TPA: DUF805 domain-containing protein [Candidatus Saccharimonadales bacterium]|nr:DUF805 domain-containing protein [Candidatus Saccharimonadales bacterium]
MAAITTPRTGHKKVAQRTIFTGRIGRLQFFLGFIYMCVPLFASITLGGLNQFLFIRGPVFTGINVMLTVVALSVILFFIPETLSLYTRRLHDLDYSGLLALLLLIPLFDIFFHFYLQFKTGGMRPNQFGEPPARDKSVWVVWGFKGSN